MRHLISLLLVALILLPQAATAVRPGEMLEDPALEARVRELGKQLRCLVCQNQSIFDSNAGLAYDLRALLRERVLAGDTDKEAIAYVAERYGDYVLLKPPVAGHTAVLWAAPVLLLLVAFGGGAIYLRRRGRPLQGQPGGPDPLEVAKFLRKDPS